TIAAGSQPLELDPVLLVASVIAQERWQIVQVQHQGIHVAVVVVIPECRASTGKAFADAWAHHCGNVLKSSVPKVLVHNALVLERLAEVVAVYLGIDMSIYLEDVLPTIVVIIDEATTPRHITIVDSNARRKGYI